MVSPTVKSEVDELPTDPHEAARAVGLRHVSGRGAGVTRRRRGSGFSYYSPKGELITDQAERERIQSLVIPPAWESVWICPSPKGHLQAAGNDERGRRQYLYHPLYRAVRDAAKFHRMPEFAAALPRIRRRVRRDLARKGLPREKVLAAVVRLIDASYLRVGNELYRKQNNSYGLTTMMRKHLTIKGKTLHLHFMGKSGKEVDISVEDRRLARALKRCRELPGKRLLQYSHNGDRGSVDSGDVNEYLNEISGGQFTAKDFRTWGGTSVGAKSLRALGPADTKTQMKRNIVDAIKAAAAALNNTPATCRKYYVHPAVIKSYESGTLNDLMDKASRRKGKHRIRGLRKIEQEVLAVLLESSEEALEQWIAEAEAA